MAASLAVPTTSPLGGAPSASSAAVALGSVPIGDQRRGRRRHADDRPGASTAVGRVFRADVHHSSTAALVEVAERVAIHPRTVAGSAGFGSARTCVRTEFCFRAEGQLSVYETS